MIYQKFLEIHGRPPDNYVKSSEGGSVEGSELAREDPAEQEVLVRGLEVQLAEIRRKSDS